MWWLTGEDPADEIAAVTGFAFRPVKVAFRQVHTWSLKQIKAFRDTDLKALAEMELAYKGWLKRLRDIESEIPQAAQQWLSEVIDGTEINMLRSKHTRLLYETIAILRETEISNAEKRKQDPNATLTQPKDAADPLWKEATDALAHAQIAIRRREKEYRYPSVQVYGGGDTPDTAIANGTTYPWRVHTKTHLLSYWHNRHEDVERMISGQEAQPNTLSATPVIALPNTPLQLQWPTAPDVQANISIGNQSITPSDTQIDLGKDEDFWPIVGTIEIGGRELQIAGGVVRANHLLITPAKGFRLLEPASAHRKPKINVDR